jgi:mannose-6-phosphate isomerase-like protein (cupin superfamily)
MKGFKSNIENDTLKNKNFRKVLYTSKYLQVVLMKLNPGEEIGEETHKNVDQFFRFEGGTGKGFIDGHVYKVSNGDAMVIPAGSKHNVINTDPTEGLMMYTIYAPPNHKNGVVNSTKNNGETRDLKFDGKTSE